MIETGLKDKVVIVTGAAAGIGLATALIARLPAGETSRTFLDGAAKMAAPALIVGFARTIALVLEDGQIIDTVVHSIASLLEGMPPDVSAVGMLVVHWPLAELSQSVAWLRALTR